MTIAHNHLNLPRLSTWTGGGFQGNSVEILYDAAGTKLRKTVKTGATVNYVQDYIGGIEYRDNVREAIYTAEGRVFHTSPTTTRYEYTIKDHLGNARLSFSDLNGNGAVDVTAAAGTNELLQENHYYPFGLGHDGPWVNDAARDNRYQYNGKEWNDDFGLNWNDYGARWYDAGVGRWWSVDPLAEPQSSYSPYHYVYNNPVFFIDPTGMFGEDPNEQYGADGLANSQWIESSRPGANKSLAKKYKNDNVAKDFAKKKYSDFMMNPINHFLKYGGEEIGRELCGNEIHIYFQQGMTINSETLRLGAAMYTEAYTRSVGVNGAFSGGIGFEIGYAKDNFGDWGLYFRVAPQLGFGGGPGINQTQLSKTNDNRPIYLSDIEGNDISYNIDLGPLGINWGGNQASKRPSGFNAFTDYGSVYNAGGYSIGDAIRNAKIKPKLDVGFRVEFGETIFLYKSK